MKNCLSFLIIMVMGFSAMAQWESDPAVNNQITPEGTTVRENLMIAPSRQCAYIVFNCPTSGTSSIGYYLQILDHAGVKVFPDPGFLVSSATSISFSMVNNFFFVDNAGNAIIVASDLRYGGSSSADMAYTLYKVSPSGTMLWGDNGVQLSANTNYGGTLINMTQLDNGNMVFAWVNMVAGNIGMQCVSPDGDLLWTEKTQMDNNKYCSYPYLVASGNDFILLYSEQNGSGSPWARYSWLKAKKFDADGNLVWGDITIYTGGYTLSVLQVIFDVVSDNDGGMLVGWYDSHAVSNREDVYVAHIKADGTLGFSGVPLRVGNHATYRSFRPKISVNPDENFFVTWEETNSSQSYSRIMLQKFSIEGVEAWTPGGIQIGDNSGASSVAYQSVQATDDGRVAHFYMKMLTPSGTTHSYISLLDADGNYVWENEQVNFSTSSSHKAGLQSTPLINEEYWLGLWEDTRGGSLTNMLLYLQRINIDGSLGAYMPEEECLPPANVEVEFMILLDNFNGETNISWEGEATGYTFAYKNITDTAWISFETTDTEVSLTDLDCDTNYLYQIRSICEDTTSIWVSGDFRTPPCNEGKIYENSHNQGITVYAENQNLYIKNRNQLPIEKVRVYQLNGALIQEYAVKSNGDLTLPLPLKTAIVMVTLQGKTFSYVYKVLIP